MILKRIVLFLLLVLAPYFGAGVLRAQSVYAAPVALDEYLVKGAFMLNFAKFVEWPPSCFPVSKKEFVIGILGMNPFSDTLVNLAKDKKIQNRRVVVRQYRGIEEVGECQMLFLGASESKTVTETLRVLEGKGILTIADFKGFVDRGGMIGFVVVDKRVQFEINELTAKRENVKFSAQLLKLAKRVIPTKR